VQINGEIAMTRKPVARGRDSPSTYNTKSEGQVQYDKKTVRRALQIVDSGLPACSRSASPNNYSVDQTAKSQFRAFRKLSSP